MAKLNTQKAARAYEIAKTDAVSHNGNPQYAKSAEQDLFEIAVSTLYGNDTYYETTDDKVNRLKKHVDVLVVNDKAHFIANLAVFARKTMLIRTMPIVLIVELADALRRHNKSLPGLKNAIAAVIDRADGLTELYAYALAVFGSKNKVPMSIKNGVAKAFNKFDEYQYGKYNSKAAVKLKDLLRIVHPTPKDELQSTLFQKIMTETVSTPKTWETELSAAGQVGKSKSEVWTEMIASGKLGYMATLRNLRNILEAGVANESITVVANRLADPEQVKKSKQFPFAFVKAAQAIDPSFGVTNRYGFSSSHAKSGADNQRSKLLNAISMALDASVNNMPRLGDGVAIIIDCSGSMQGVPFDTACLLAAAAAKSNSLASNMAVIMFSDNAQKVDIRTNDSVMSIYEKLQRYNAGGGTNLQAALNLVPNLGFTPDVAFVLSDMQVNMLSGPQAANRVFKKNILKLAFNLSAYGSTPMSEIDGWIQLAGFSERIFDYISYKEKGPSVVEMLNSTKLYD
jgi:60 kDa SS-A/Ro ribonucleoprotein